MDDAGKLDAVMESVDKHLEQMTGQFKNYIPEEVAKIENAVVWQGGSHVLVCISNDYATAKAILDKIYFYPPAQHAYQCSICGRNCDVECYVHLEEMGVLTKKFKTPFRKRTPWEFSLEDYK
jgi:hypothetical protein